MKYLKGATQNFKKMRNPRVRLKILRKKNPQDMQAPDKFYVQAVKTANVNLAWLAKLISNQSTVRKPDCLAVLCAFVDNMIDELQRGSMVRLDGLGTFQLSVNSLGSDREEHVTVHNVKRVHLNFRPSAELKEALGNVKFTLTEPE